MSHIAFHHDSRI